MFDYDALKKQYNTLEDACRSLTERESDLEDFRSRMLAYVFRVWSAQTGYHEDYVTAASIMTGDSRFDEAVIKHFLKQAKEEQHMTIQPMFVSLVFLENSQKNGIAKTFVDLMINFLVDMAFVNGDCVPEEADEIEHIRMLHMDFYKDFMLHARRVREGSIPAGEYRYERFGAHVSCILDQNGQITGKSDEEDEEDEKGSPSKNRHISKLRIPDELFQVDLFSGSSAGITDVKVYGYVESKQLCIIGQLFAENGLKDEFSISAIVYDQDGDVLGRVQNRGYGGGSLICSIVRKRSFFQGYPFSIYYSMDGGLETISRIRIVFD